MTENISQFEEIILKAIDGTITQSEFAILQKELSDNPQKARYYVEFVADYILLKYHSETISKSNTTAIFPCDTGYDVTLWAELAQNEKTAKPVKTVKTTEPSTTEKIHRVNIEQPVRRFPKSSLYTALSAIAALIFIVIYINTLDSRYRPEVARLTDSSNMVWTEADSQLQAGADLRIGPMDLAGGLVKIVFDNGAEVIIEGPAQFDLQSAGQMFLKHGKLVALVPRKAIGFVVRTPVATVVDYGTEFGVTANRKGQTETHVFQGQVELRAGSDPGVYGLAKQFSTGQAGQVNENGDLSEITIKPSDFTRNMHLLYEMAVRKSVPVAYWRFDGSDHNRVVNVMDPSAYTGTYTSQVQFAQGPQLGNEANTALHCFGKNASFVDFGHYFDPGAKSFSISFWLKVPSEKWSSGYYGILKTPPKQFQIPQEYFTSQQTIISKGMLHSGMPGWSIHTAGRALILRSHDNGTEGLERVGKQNLQALKDDWLHVVMVIDRDRNVINGYLNGTSDGWIDGWEGAETTEWSSSYQPGTSITAADQKFMIGQQYYNTYVDFLIDEIALWNRALSQDEVASLYQSARSTNK